MKSTVKTLRSNYPIPLSVHRIVLKPFLPMEFPIYISILASCLHPVDIASLQPEQRIFGGFTMVISIFLVDNKEVFNSFIHIKIKHQRS